MMDARHAQQISATINLYFRIECAECGSALSSFEKEGTIYVYSCFNCKITPDTPQESDPEHE